jgi:DNA-binding response OmpR family regulator
LFEVFFVGFFNKGEETMMGKVLVVENEPTLSTLAGVLSGCWNYSVLRVSDVRLALRGAAVWQPDVIVAEGLELDGGWLCEELKKLRPTQNIPVIIISHKKDSSSDAEMWQYFANRYGADEYVAKPFCIDRLVQMIMWCHWQAKHNHQAVTTSNGEPLWVGVQKMPG